MVPGFNYFHCMKFIRTIITGLLWAGTLLFVNVQTSLAQELQRYSFDSRHMGTQITIILYAGDETVAYRAAEASFERIEELNQMMSDYIETSEINRLSQKSGSGEWMKISDDLYEVLETSVQISEMTGGLFDVTMGPVTHEWRYIRMMGEPELPDDEELKKLLDRVGYRQIELDGQTGSVRLKREKMQLDLGGIAKGYAAEKAIERLREFGIESALVDAGGDITVSSPPPGRESWTVAVPKGITEGDRSMASLKIRDRTVTTSGDMFQFLEINGVRYSHIINPKTGFGSTHRIQATVISDSGMYADALASACTLMQPDECLELINEIEDTEVILFRTQNGEIEEWSTEGFSRFMN
jgi:FAD:protein FMN transferase